jgi:hypothetical protein
LNSSTGLFIKNSYSFYLPYKTSKLKGIIEAKDFLLKKSNGSWFWINQSVFVSGFRLLISTQSNASFLNGINIEVKLK